MTPREAVVVLLHSMQSHLKKLSKLNPGDRITAEEWQAICQLSTDHHDLVVHTIKLRAELEQSEIECENLRN